MTRAELAAKIKTKYPQYADMEDGVLVDKIVSKYPQYQAQITEPQSEVAPVSVPDERNEPGHWSGRLASAAMRQVPLSALDAAKLGPLALGGRLADFAMESLGFDSRGAGDQRSSVEASARAPYQPTSGEGTAGAIGRGITRAAPQMGLAALTGGASVPAQAAILGAAGGAQAAAEGGGVISGAVGGAAAPLVGPVASRALGGPARALKNVAVRQYERGLGATKEALKYEAARIAPELLERGTFGTLKGLSKKASALVDRLGSQIDEAYKTASRSGKTISGPRLAEALEPLKEPFRAIGGSGDDVALNPQAVKAIEDVQQILVDLGENASPSTLWKFRKVVDDVVSASNGFTKELPRGTTRALQKRVRGVLQSELTKSVPSVERLNSEFRLWRGLQNVVDATIKRRTSQERSLIPALGAVVGAAGGAGAGSGGAALGAITLPLLIKAVRSPLWRTFSAAQKMKLAGALSGGAERLSTEEARRLAAMVTLAAEGATRGALQAEPTRTQRGPQ